MTGLLVFKTLALKHGLDEQIMRWTENWLNGWARRVVISGMTSSWRPVSSSETPVNPRAQYWVQSCSTFSLMVWMIGQCTLSKFSDDTKL